MKEGAPSMQLAFRIYWGIAIGLAMGFLSYIYCLRATMLWDFKTSFAAGWLVRHGQNPYDNRLLFPLIAPYDFPVAYSLPAIGFFVPFTFLDYPLAAVIWMVAMTGCWIALLVLWSRHFAGGQSSPWFPLLALFAFNLAIAKNLVTGNIATVEALLLWIAFLFLVRKKMAGFVIFLLLGASFKMTPIVFLGLPLLHPQLRRWKTVCLSAAIFLCYLLTTYLFAPKWFPYYQANLLFNVKEWALRDIFNPSSFALSRRLVFGALPSLSAEENLRMGSVLYFILIIPIIVVSAKVMIKLSRQSWDAVGKIIILYATLVYALIVPRLSDYSFTLLIPAALYVITMLPRTEALLLMGALVLSLFQISFADDVAFVGDFSFGGWAYWSLLMVFVCWTIFSRHLLKTRNSSSSARRSLSKQQEKELSEQPS
jgi:hypothetical protein